MPSDHMALDAGDEHYVVLRKIDPVHEYNMEVLACNRGKGHTFQDLAHLRLKVRPPPGVFC